MATRKSERFKPSNALPENELTPNNVTTRSGRQVIPSRRSGDIVKLFEKRTPSKQKMKNQSSSSDNQMSCSEGEDDYENDENRVELAHATELLHGDDDVAGRALYQFHTPKKRDAMMQLAENTTKTPTTGLKQLSLNSPRTPQTPRTPKGRVTSLQRMKQNTTTPHETRVRNKATLEKQFRKKTQQESETESSADEDADYEPEGSSESSDEEKSNDSASDSDGRPEQDSRKVPPIKISTKSGRVTSMPAPPSGRMNTRGQSRAKNQEDFIPDSDNYFITASNKKSKTSDHTLDRLKSSRLQHEELFNLLGNIHTSEEHEHRITEMFQDLQLNFKRWMLEISQGYNIILFGSGSKQQLLHSFCEKHLADKPVIVVNGFFPSLTVKDILQAIKVQLLEITATSRNDHETVDLIASTLDNIPNGHVFLVINNIDGVMLRKTKDQHIISRLAKINNLHLIASIDHINAPLMWDQTCMDNFNFVWYDCTTLLPYKNETAFENSVFFQNSGELDLAAMSNVFRSLTTNARGIYMILVNNQIANHKDSNYQGMTFKDLYHKCRESFLVSSDSTLRTQLIEFVDHNMAKIKRSHDGTEQVTIPISIQILSLFTQQQND